MHRDFEAVYEACYDPVARYVLRRVGSDRAHDVVAETFLIAWRRLESLPSEPLPWLLGAARRVIANDLRSQRRKRALQIRVVETEGRNQVTFADEQGVALEAFYRLHPRDQETLALLAWEELDAEAAAASLGCSANAFRVRLHRARQRFKDQLGQATPHSEDATTSLGKRQEARC
jgi:RNA polymerase sigma-70 factor (ECF subfamily)